MYFKWLQKGVPANPVERYPQLTEDGETTLSGVYVVGDLTGIPLLKYAADGGAKKVQELIEKGSFKDNQKEDIEDLIIVGAGPAGVSAGIKAHQEKLKFKIIESNKPFSTIANFPKKKPIFLEPKSYSLEGPLKLSGDVKEKLLDEMQDQYDKEHLDIIHENVTKLSNHGGIIHVQTKDNTFKAKKVVLAIGKSGNYRKLGAKGESLSKVSNRLLGATGYENQDVLVVGGGDNALETAITLAEHDAKVTLSYRKKEFSRPKEGNAEKIKQLTESGKIKLEMESSLKEITESSVTLSRGKEIWTIDNHDVFVMIGRELPVPFLKRSGIQLEGEKTPFWYLSFTAMMSFFVMLYFVKATERAQNILGDGSIGLWDKFVNYLKTPFLISYSSWKFWDIFYLLGGWGSGVLFLLTGLFSVLYTLKERKRYYATPWQIFKHSYYIVMAVWFFLFHLKHHFGVNSIDWLRGTVFFYSFLYTITMLIFGLRRMYVKPSRYIIKQTTTLIFIQSFFLFLFPFYLYDLLLAPYSHTAIVQQLFPEGLWSSFGFILFWPLNMWTFGTSTFWTIFPFIQTFVILPYIVIRWGKGAYCGWVCSCGGMAETLGDEYRTKAPHGAKAKKAENIGQIILWFALIVLVTQLVSANFGSAALVGAFKQGALAKVYKLIVDVLFAGALGLGVYFFYSGRLWCRFGCPLAALMHLYAKFTKYRIFADKKKCISCNVCTKVCHMGIDVMNFANKGKPMEDVECVRCSACVVNCPTEVLSFGSLKKGSKTEPQHLEVGTRV